MASRHRAAATHFGGETMKKVFAIAAAIALLSLGIAAQAITIDTVRVGDAGNAADGTGYGSVAYNYNIGKYEVTAGQYTDFLNNKAKTDNYGLYNTNMDTAVYSDGCNIKRNGSSGNYNYSVASDWANRPVNYVSYWDSLRFTNWLGNGQGNSSTETGAYTIPNGYNGIDGRAIQRNAGATWALTSEDEWYKAAYYKGGGLYSLYANGTSTLPVAGTTGSNYDWAIGHTWDGTINGALEQNGTKDMMGNVWEWNEAIPYQGANYACRGLRGGSFSGYDSTLQSTSRSDGVDHPDYESYYVGFRVSQVPEPSSIIALLGGLAGLIGLRRRRA